MNLRRPKVVVALGLIPDTGKQAYRGLNLLLQKPDHEGHEIVKIQR